MARILIADDDPSLRYAMSSALKDRQHVVDVAENGQQAIDLCQRNSYDLLLLDILMPEKNGIEFLRELRELHAADEPRVIAVSGGNAALPGKYALTVAQSLGVSASLYKPFSRRELLDAVDTALA